MVSPGEILSAFQAAAPLIKKHKDRELLEKFLDLQMKVSEFHHQNEVLHEELRTLRRKMQEFESLTWDSDGEVYRKAGDPMPFCPQCREDSEKVIHLRRAERGFYCSVCGFLIGDNGTIGAMCG